MQDAKVSLCVFKLVQIEDVAVFEPDIVRLVEKALALNAGHIQNVELRHNGLKVLRFDVIYIVFVQHVLAQIIRNHQLLRRDAHEAHIVVPRHGADKRVHGSAKLQVTANADGKIVQSTFFALNGQKVGKRLGGVVVSAVARVYYRHGRLHRGNKRRTLLGVAHCDNVRITADGANPYR